MPLEASLQVVLPGVVTVHAQEAASLWESRMVHRRAPHVDLNALTEIDDRLAAHLDGLATAGAQAQVVLDTELEQSSAGAAFVASVRAIEDGRPASMDPLWSLVTERRSALVGLTGAFGWVEGRHLQRLVRDLLKSADSMKRTVGLSACAMHRVDPGLETGPWLEDPVSAVRARALRTVGELGLTALASRCMRAMSDDDSECRFWAAWAGVLLGNRSVALDALSRLALSGTALPRTRALHLALQALDAASAHEVLRAISRAPERRRWLIQGSGVEGDSVYAPWLIGHMTTHETARLAVEAFTLITGANVDALQLWKQQPEDLQSRPSDDPGDDDVDMDPDEGLMWPDPDKVQAWWDKNASRFQPGVRYFMGAPVTREHCIEVLKNGYQRQRILAAHYLCLLDPGTPLFNTSAPAWRQKKLLDQMV